MRTVFEYDRDKRILDAYSFSNVSRVNSIIESFKKDAGKFLCDKSKRFSSSEYLGDDKLIYSPDKVAYQRIIGREYLGKSLQSNVGVACNGCDHCYEDSYEYRYEKCDLSKSISDAFLILFNMTLYGTEIEEYCEYPRRYSSRNIKTLEKEALMSIKKKLEQVPDKYEDFLSEEDMLLFCHILRCIDVQKQSYEIKSVDDFRTIMKDTCRHVAMYNLSIYLHDNKFKSIEEFLTSLKGESLSEEGRIVKETFESFDLTPEWVEVAKEAHQKQVKILSGWRK